MSQIASLYIVKAADLLAGRFTSAAVEKIDYKWSGYTFIILSAYSEEIGLDWDKLEHHDLSIALSEKTGTWITLFSIHDKQSVLSELNPAVLSLDELENFALAFSGDKGFGNAIFDAVKILNASLNKIDEESVVLLEVT